MDLIRKKKITQNTITTTVSTMFDPLTPSCGPRVTHPLPACAVLDEDPVVAAELAAFKAELDAEAAKLSPAPESVAPPISADLSALIAAEVEKRLAEMGLGPAPVKKGGKPVKE